MNRPMGRIKLRLKGGIEKGRILIGDKGRWGESERHLTDWKEMN